MLAGSPPCSPQTPSLSFGRALRPALGGHLDERADALLIERDERILRQDARLDVRGQELPGVVAREAHRGLREVVRAEGEELRRLRELAGQDGGARQLDHRAEREGDRLAAFVEDLLRDVVDDGARLLELARA